MLGLELETDCLWNLLHNACQTRSSKETFETMTEFKTVVTAAKQRDGEKSLVHDPNEQRAS